MKGKIIHTHVDEYIASFPEDVRQVLKDIRATIRKSAPDAEETISYGMPAFKYHGMLVYFAAYEKHIGFYATPSGHKKFEKELSKYKQGKGSVQFPLNAPIPLGLISEIVKFRANENKTKALLKTRK
ncbi:iron chaperone [Maribacter algicola]|uniref:Iron chaperone n=1 Tax=Meishania litoralis TaxID=3434685 RepID=A0ACC7LHQ7_9FLAO